MECVRKIGSHLFRSVFMGSRVNGAIKRGDGRLGSVSDYCVDEKDPAGSAEPVVSIAEADGDEDDTDYEEEMRYWDEEIERLSKWRPGTNKPENWIKAGLPVMSDEEYARRKEEYWEEWKIERKKMDLPAPRDNSAQWKK